MKLSKSVLLLLSLSCLFASAQNIKDPNVNLPHLQFDALYNQNKIINPIFLEGKVASVTRIFTQHVSPYSDFSYTEKYNYELNKNKQVLAYSSNLDFDETTSASFNEAPEFKVKKDTIIKKDNKKYVFKKGLLILMEDRDNQLGNLDSIVFSYNKGKLKSEIHFASQGLFEVDDFGDVDENEMVYDVFNAKYYATYNYNKNGLLSAFKNHEANQDIVSTVEIKNNYNSNKSLKSYTINNKMFYANGVDVYAHPESWKFDMDYLVEDGVVEINGFYNYDTQGRIISHEYKTSKNENGVFKVIYSKNKYLIKVSRDYLNSYGQLVHQDLEYDYTLDHLKNPIQVHSYIIKNNKRLLDKSTVLEITYFKN